MKTCEHGRQRRFGFSVGILELVTSRSPGGRCRSHESWGSSLPFFFRRNTSLPFEWWQFSEPVVSVCVFSGRLQKKKVLICLSKVTISSYGANQITLLFDSDCVNIVFIEPTYGEEKSLNHLEASLALATAAHEPTRLCASFFTLTNNSVATMLTIRFDQLSVRFFHTLEVPYQAVLNQDSRSVHV